MSKFKAFFLMIVGGLLCMGVGVYFSNTLLTTTSTTVKKTLTRYFESQSLYDAGTTQVDMAPKGNTQSRAISSKKSIKQQDSQFRCLMPESPYPYEQFKLAESTAPTVKIKVNTIGGMEATSLRPSFGDVDLDGDIDLVVHAHDGYYYFENKNKKLHFTPSSKIKNKYGTQSGIETKSNLDINSFEVLYNHLSKVNKRPINGIIDFVKLNNATKQNVFITNYTITHFKRLNKNKISLNAVYSNIFSYSGNHSFFVNHHVGDINQDGKADILFSTYIDGGIKYISLDENTTNENCKKLKSNFNDATICDENRYLNVTYSIGGWVDTNHLPCQTKKWILNTPVNVVDIDNDGDMDIVAGDKSQLFLLENKGNLSQVEKSIKSKNEYSGTCVTNAFEKVNFRGFKNVHASDRSALHIQESIDVMGQAKKNYILYKKQIHKKGEGDPRNLSMIELRYYDGNRYDAIDFDFGDIDNDGDPDLVIGTLEGRLQFYENIKGVFIQNGKFTHK